MKTAVSRIKAFGRFIRDLFGGRIYRTLAAMAGVDNGYFKVFAIGFNKSATSSIHAVFESCGLRALHHGDNGRWGRETPFSLPFYEYDAFSDGVIQNFRVFDTRMKGNKFILNVRDLAEWLDSRLQHLKHDHEIGLFSQNKYWQPTEEAVLHWIVERNRYHLEVLQYFENRPRDLLIVNYIRDPDAAQKISEFIGKESTSERVYVRPIPKSRELGVLSNKELIEKCLNTLQIPESEWHDDLYCQSLVRDTQMHRFPTDTRFLES